MSILNILNLKIGRLFPRHATRFAIKHFKGKLINVIEIGVYEGENAQNILDNLKVWKIYLVDPYVDYGEEDKDNKDLERAEKKAHKILDEEYFYEVNWIQVHSDRAVDIVPKADFIYIDGNHTYKQVKKDMENYWKKVKKNGILAGHDIANPRDDYGVAKAFVEFCSENKLKPFIGGDDWWIVKK